MYFEIENTPETIRTKKKISNNEDTPPKLTLAPFSAAPKVVFDSVPIGRKATQRLDIHNPTNKTLQISLIKEPNPELGLNLPEREFEILSGETLQLCLFWQPCKTVSVRESLQFQDDYRGRYEVVLIFKSIAVKKSTKSVSKRTPPKVISKKLVKKKSPLKVRSPPKVTLSKVIKNNMSSSKTFRKTDMFVDFHLSNKENSIVKNPFEESYFSPLSLKEQVPACNLTGRATFLVSDQNRGKMVANPPKSILSCIENLVFTPLKSKTDKSNFIETKNANTSSHFHDENNENMNFDPSKNREDDIRKDMKYIQHRNRYDFDPRNDNAIQHKNSSRQPTYSLNNSFADSFDNEINHLKCNNDTHPIIDLRNIDASVTTIIDSPEHKQTTEERIMELRTPENYDSFMIDVTVSPKHGKPSIAVSSPNHVDGVNGKTESNQERSKSQNISIVINNMGCSHLNDSEIMFNPHRCSTERKEPPPETVLGKNRSISPICKGLFMNNSSFMDKPNHCSKHNDNHEKLTSKALADRPDSPIVPLDPSNPYNKQSSPYAFDSNISGTVLGEVNVKMLQTRVTTDANDFYHSFERRQSGRKRSAIDRNCGDNVKSVIEANLWQRTSPKSLISLPLIPEESCLLSESQYSSKKIETFTFDRTYDLPPENGSFCIPNKRHKSNISNNNSSKIWSKSATKTDNVVWKVPQVQNSSDKFINPDLLIINAYSTATTIDPFLSTTYFYDEELVDKFENEFKRWLNCLLTPPAELEVATDGPRIDVGKIWIENRNKEIPEAPTKEQVSNKYHTSHRLDSLRKSARNLLLSESVMSVFVKLSAQIDKKVLSIRPDKNLHLDVGLQKIIMDLLLCYNPLWLRMGLEAIYGTTIPLTSNNDILGLSTFIIQRMFRDPYMKAKQSQSSLPNMITPQYTEHMRKFTLKKYFMLVYILDQAKQKKLIYHDPCLFCRTAPYKESREMLIRFTRELITGVGDITKHLRPLGYVVTHKQSELDEFKYAVHNLATDLKDGVRLTKLMEIILVKEGLTSKLRLPAISRLQKIHNVKLALTSLNEAGFNITGDITARDISDGHREKTLSLLWQIIHTFRAPLFEKAATTIQLWWRKKYLMVWIKNRIQQRKFERLSNAATIIQSRWRAFSARKYYISRLRATVNACIVIQKYWRRWYNKTVFNKTKNAVVIIQKWYRNIKEIKKAQLELQIRRKRYHSANLIQHWYKRLLCARKIIAVLNVYKEYSNDVKLKINAANIIKRSVKSFIIHKKFHSVFITLMASEFRKNKKATIIQACFRGYIQRIKFNKLKKHVIRIQAITRGILLRSRMALYKHNVIRIQQLYRAKFLMKKAVRDFKTILAAVIKIQSYWRMYHNQNKYSILKKSVILVQQHFRANLAMKAQRAAYLNDIKKIIFIQSIIRQQIATRKFIRIRKAVIIIQQRVKAQKSMKICRDQFIELKTSTIILQKHFRRIFVQKYYTQLRKAVISVQVRYRALQQMRTCMIEYKQTLFLIRSIQNRYKAKLLMRKQRIKYVSKRNAILCIQSHWRALIAMRDKRQQYVVLKKSTIKIQSYYRAFIAGRKARNEYLKLKKVVISLQTKVRARNLGRQKRQEYCQLKQSAIKIQRHYRSYRLMKLLSNNFKRLKHHTIKIQILYRSIIMMKRDKQNYIMKKTACINVQKWYRASQCARTCRNNYLNLKRACVVIQRKFRANRMMKCALQKFIQIKETCVYIQRKFRANKMMRHAKATYYHQKQACYIIQNRFRALRSMKLERLNFLQLKAAAITIQRQYRALRAMKIARSDYVATREKVTLIQVCFRANRVMKIDRASYLAKRKACIKVQRYYRAFKCMLKLRNDYLKIKKACIYIQKKIRAHILMKQVRHEYLTLKHACVVIQSHYKANLIARKQRCDYLRVRVACTNIQQRYRSLQLMRKTKNDYLKFRQSCVAIQRWLRAIWLMRCDRNEFQKQKKLIIMCQRKYRAKTLMLAAKIKYKKKRKAIICIQRFYRSQKAMRTCKQTYVLLRTKTISIQRWYRSILLMRKQRKYFLDLKCSVVKVQHCYKAKLLMQKHRNRFLLVKRVTLLMQQSYRYKKLMENQRQLFIHQKLCSIKIQAYYRMITVQRNYLKIKKATKIIQMHYRSSVQTRKCRERYLYVKKCIVRIQSVIRCFVAKKKYLRFKTAVLVIQAAYRQKKAIEDARSFRKRIISAAISSQALVRGYLARKRYAKKVNAILCIQRFWKNGLLAKTERKHYLYLLSNIVRIQAMARGYLMRKNFAKLKEELILKKEEERKINAAVKIQALWKAYSVRKMYFDVRVINLRKRWKEGALESNQQTLAERHEDALEVLNHFSDMASVIRAFLSLDLLTRVYPMLYEKEELSRTVSEKLILYMSATNRSISSLETLRLSASILVNLTKYKATAHFVYSKSHVNIILTLMMRWCDNDSQFFRFLCTLIWLFGNYDFMYKELCVILVQGDNIKMLNKIRSSIQRKTRMEERTRKQQTLQNRKLNMCLNSSKLNHTLKESNTIILPSPKPDFGISQPHKPRVFQNDLQAIDNLFVKFKLLT